MGSYSASGDKWVWVNIRDVSSSSLNISLISILGLIFRYHSSIFFYRSMLALNHMLLTGRKMTNFFHRQINFEQWKLNFDGVECPCYLKLKISFLKIFNLGMYFLCDMMRHVRRNTCHYPLSRLAALAAIMVKNGNKMKQGICYL